MVLGSDNICSTPGLTKGTRRYHDWVEIDNADMTSTSLRKGATTWMGKWTLLMMVEKDPVRQSLSTVVFFLITFRQVGKLHQAWTVPVGSKNRWVADGDGMALGRRREIWDGVGMPVGDRG